MKISLVKTFVKKNIPWVFIVGGFGIASYCTNKGLNRITEVENEAKSYIQNNDKEKYDSLVLEDKWPKSFNWVIEAQNLEAELKLDSIAKANYALGMQAVRDSLANANKK